MSDVFKDALETRNEGPCRQLTALVEFEGDLDSGVGGHDDVEVFAVDVQRADQATQVRFFELALHQGNEQGRARHARRDGLDGVVRERPLRRQRCALFEIDADGVVREGDADGA